MVWQPKNESDQALIVTFADIRAAGFSCKKEGPRRVRRFFERYDLSWDDLKNNRLTVADLLKTNNSLAIKVARVCCGE